ncbi:hypothetical protein EVAR_57391_1 [Eumeta japonica]|uniref:Uncharacterized protein n=1 Tax=Eumeta variegata TaxID=151549 RepID=A0A4C1YBR0_EUMVA|nr:hypothetical protein EVAR_57391_1 [Eumeta japonica]
MYGAVPIEVMTYHDERCLQSQTEERDKWPWSTYPCYSLPKFIKFNVPGNLERTTGGYWICQRISLWACAGQSYFRTGESGALGSIEVTRFATRHA